MADLVRVAALTGYLETMAGFATDPRALLREQGLHPDLLNSPEQLIPAKAAARLLERSAAATGCETLGLRMAEGRSLANLGATSLLIAHQPSLRHALAALAEFGGRINSTLALHLSEHDGEAIVREDLAVGQPEATRQSADLVLGVLVRMCRSVLGERWSPTLACFSHQPPRTDLALFSRFFRCPLQFDSAFNGLVIASVDLDRPNARADAQLAHHARQLLEAVHAPAMRTTRHEVDQSIRLLLPSGRATIETCAAAIGTTVRTLQRLLDAEGVSFTQLLDETRMQLAAQYLANPRMRITDIAGLLGYGSIGAFTRWSTRVFGRSPTAMRKSLSA